jgi:hypothetical protein
VVQLAKDYCGVSPSERVCIDIDGATVKANHPYSDQTWPIWIGIHTSCRSD